MWTVETEERCESESCLLLDQSEHWRDLVDVDLREGMSLKVQRPVYGRNNYIRVEHGKEQL